ncbi:MAG: protoporphyrinogen oxidase HemJ [Lysobacteraceae bacterium]
MLWVKAFHIIFVVTWFAGLFYLPRLFVYHAELQAGGSDRVGHERFLVMERRLMGITNIGAALALLFGIWLLWLVPGFLQMGWMHAKLGLILLLVGYHGFCARLCGDFRRGSNQRSGRWFRVFNEVPAVLLVAIVCLVVVKPF